MKERLIHASLLASAMGDSLGADIEFMSLAAIRRRFPQGLHELPAHDGIVGAITDDTQMTLFTAEGLIESAGLPLDERVKAVHAALLRWLETQGPKPSLSPQGKERVGRDRGNSEGKSLERHVLTESNPSSPQPLSSLSKGKGGEGLLKPSAPGLISDQRLWAARAPGMTCLSGLRARLPLGAPARNDSKGCGTIMRVAPVAFAAARGEIRELAMRTSALTHGHPTGQRAAAFWAELLADVAAGAPAEASARALAEEYARLEGGAETAAAARRALAAPRDGRPETVESLGGAWAAEEALAIGLYAALAAPDLEEGLRVAVTHGGDSDSAGAVAGALLGLMYPDQALSHPWGRQIECADLIAGLALDLFAS